MNSRTMTVVGMIVVAMLTRLIKHDPNFAAVTAAALFGAAYLPTRRMAIGTILVALFLSDVALEGLTRFHLVTGWMETGRGFYHGMWIVYGTVGIITLLGFVLRKRHSVPAIASATLLSSLVFFLITNFAWWASYSLYPHTWAGLLESYAQGIPFFHWTVLGDLFFAAVLFGGFALAEKRIPALAQSSR